MASSNTQARRPPTLRMVQNFHLVWLDGRIDEMNNADCRNSIMKLRQVVNTINTFTDLDECIDFITDTNEVMTSIIISEEYIQFVVPILQEISQVTSIYIFCGNKTQHEGWVKQWTKVKGVFTDITSICEALKQAAQDCDHNSISISFVQKADGPSNQNLDTLDQSFMYTQILKEILLTIDFKRSHINDFLTYSREQLMDNTTQLANVDKIAKEYHDHQPIWWYTYPSFLYSMLNRALRLMEVDRIIKIGFFVRDLHNHIVTLHAKQFNGQNHSDSFIVYRGQRLNQTDFDQLKNNQGGLLAFNNFLSTSKNSNVSFRFAQQTAATSDLMGILFIMNIDPSISATPFANVATVGYYEGKEEEILFSMHSVFRIEQVQQTEGNNRLYQVNLTLTSDNDPQLHALTKSMQEETSGSTGWNRLGQLMITLGQFNKAEDLCNILFEQTNGEGGKAQVYHMLGIVKANQGKYAVAVEYFENSIKINQKILPPTHSYLVSSYGNIGVVYDNMGEYSKALSYYEKALEIRQKSLPENHPDLATSYNNIGLVYNNMGEYSKVLSYYEKTLEIFQKSLPTNHPHLATSYNNIGGVYYNMGEHSKALSYYQKALEIRQTTLLENHPDLATSYNNIGSVYYDMGEYSKAFSHYEKALEAFEKSLSTNHPHLATSYNNIGSVYYNMGEHSKALSHFERALDIWKRALPPNHPNIEDVKKIIQTVKTKL